MGSMSCYFVPPSDRAAEFHRFLHKPQQPVCSFHFGPLALCLCCFAFTGPTGSSTKQSNSWTEEAELNQATAHAPQTCRESLCCPGGVPAAGRPTIPLLAALGKGFHLHNGGSVKLEEKCKILAPTDFMNDLHPFIFMQTWVFKNLFLTKESCWSHVSPWRGTPLDGGDSWSSPRLTDPPVPLEQVLKEHTSFWNLPWLSHSSHYMFN